MQWFRFYHEALDDPKVQLLPPDDFKHWVNLLCLANQQKTRGTLPSLCDIAFRLRLPQEEVIPLLTRLNKLELIDRVDGVVWMHNWNGRQRRSDDVALRVAEHRERLAMEETLQIGPGNVTDLLPVTPPEAEADTEADTETELPTAAREPEPFESTLTEREVATRIRAVPGMGHVSDADIIRHLREVLEDRGEPIPERAVLSDAGRFRDHWIEKRAKAPPGKWAGWKKAVRNWFERTRDVSDEQEHRNGHGTLPADRGSRKDPASQVGDGMGDVSAYTRDAGGINIRVAGMAADRRG